MDAIGKLRGDMEKQKAERYQGTQDSLRAGGSVPTGSSDPNTCLTGRPLRPEGLQADFAGSNAGFSGFSPDGTVEPCVLWGPRGLQAQGFKSCPRSKCSGMHEDYYREVLEDDNTKRPGNCPALDPVECNSQILEALKSDAKRADFHLKEVGKGLLKAATIIVKLLTVLDNFTQEGNSGGSGS
ncbi:hypothetical protein E2C01_054107 [Portunus trituberculatus]|uniref:Uncharacterized protein n=1 Tax=Portunus trituberculatus TaxID=210409 RepID=A0A5B7GJ03_PORTR|nr:hypothetical protein [Portunus trituberculatus]